MQTTLLHRVHTVTKVPQRNECLVISPVLFVADQSQYFESQVADRCPARLLCKPPALNLQTI